MDAADEMHPAASSKQHVSCSADINGDNPAPVNTIDHRIHSASRGGQLDHDHGPHSQHTTRVPTSHQIHPGSAHENRLCLLPPEILLAILERLMIEELLPFQHVSHHFRYLARTMLLDRFSDHLSLRRRRQRNLIATASKADSDVAMYSETSSLSHHPADYNDPQQHDDGEYLDPTSIAVFLFRDRHHFPLHWHECQTVRFHCIGVDRIKEELTFAPVDDHPAYNTLTMDMTEHQHQDRSMPPFLNPAMIDPILLGQATRFKCPAIGLNFFDYSTGQSRFTTAHDILNNGADGYLANSPGSVVNSLKMRTTRTFVDHERHGERYSILGIKHGAWMETGVQRRALPKENKSWSPVPSDRDTVIAKVPMVCLASESYMDVSFDESRLGHGLRDGIVSEEGAGQKKKRSIESAGRPYLKSEEMQGRAVRRSKIHHHSLHSLDGEPSRSQSLMNSARYCCLHHDQFLHESTAVTLKNDDDANQEEAAILRWQLDSPAQTTARTKDWLMDYRVYSAEDSQCAGCRSASRSFVQQSQLLRVELRQLKVSLQWILSGFA